MRRAPPSRSAASVAARAARAHDRSVSAIVRTGAGRSATATSTRAPARRSEAASSASASRRPAVEPSETISTSSPPPAAPAPLISGHGPVDVLDTARLEAGRAQQRHRPQRRGPLDVEARAVASLDRADGGILPPPGERPDDREARRDTRDLRGEERQPPGE